MVARAELLALALLQAAAAAAVWRAWQRTRESVRLLDLQNQTLAEELERREQMRIDERKGRVTAEKELRRVMDEKLDTSKGYFVQSIGQVRSCFRACLGTPRQGLLAPSTRARIEFQRSISPDTLVGLSEFSHVWIIFVFHKNTNGKNSRAHDGLRSDSHRYTFRAKIAPPMLKERVGIFSTRSPHRPNPIGITLAKIERVDAPSRAVHISGVDLVDETPVLDIKPYVPGYDCLPDAHAAAWVAPEDQLLPEVHWQDPALAATMRALASTSSHYRDAPSAFVRAVEEVLQVDVRSKEQTKRWCDPSAVSRVCVDNARIEYCVVLPDDTRCTEERAPTRIFIRAVSDASVVVGVET